MTSKQENFHPDRFKTQPNKEKINKQTQRDPSETQ